LMMSLWDALRMNMMISYQELVRTFLSSRDDIAHHIFKLNHASPHFYYRENTCEKSLQMHQQGC
ncbi:hypothetical protein, partial [Klebsiella pneumoniae]